MKRLFLVLSFATQGRVKATFYDRESLEGAVSCHAVAKGK